MEKNRKFKKRSKVIQLFNWTKPVIAHDNQNDPLINYSNYLALQLWSRSWEEMIGLPSKLTAPIQERKNRSSTLRQVMKNNAIKGYEGIRINSKGQIFSIKDVYIWTVWDEESKPFGQAATFYKWEMM